MEPPPFGHFPDEGDEFTAQPPLSPWATRFGIAPTCPPSIKQTGSSGLAPKLPPLNPKWYGTPVDGPAMRFPRPTEEALDMVFFTERLQQSYLAGLRTYEAASLNGTLVSDIDGGHRLDVPDVDMDENAERRIEEMREVGDMPHAFGRNDSPGELMMRLGTLRVNQEVWCKAFARERWYDLKANVRERMPGAIPLIGETSVWSVDDPAIWDEMKVPLELADRLLKSSIQTGL